MRNRDFDLGRRLVLKMCIRESRPDRRAPLLGKGMKFTEGEQANCGERPAREDRALMGTYA